VHLLTRGPDATVRDVAPPARAGLVVSKAVGGSVVRHRVARRLRHLLREHIAALPVGSRLVVRAAPSAGTAPWEQLESDLETALLAALRAAAAAGRRSVSLPPSQSPSARPAD